MWSHGLHPAGGRSVKLTDLHGYCITISPIQCHVGNCAGITPAALSISLLRADEAHIAENLPVWIQTPLPQRRILGRRSHLSRARLPPLLLPLTLDACGRPDTVDQEFGMRVVRVEIYQLLDRGVLWFEEALTRFTVSHVVVAG